MKKLTIKEIAKMAGVSPTAVSFVINNKEGVSEETRIKVNEIIERTNFKPSLNSKRLLSKKSYNISLILNPTSSPFKDLFYFEITRGILEKSRELGYNIVIGEIYAGHDGKNKLPDIIYSNDTDGVIFLQDISREIQNEISKTGIPFLVVDSHSFNEGFPCVSTDYTEASYTAAKYLIGCGHKNIAFFTSSFIPDFYMQTFTGFKKAMNEADLSILPSHIQSNVKDETTAFACMEQLLKNSDIPTAVLCTVDIFAVGAIQCAKDNQFKVPEDISFIGIDDILLSNYIEPKLTTIKIDKIQMGALAMELIAKKINEEKTDSVVLRSDELIIRESVLKLSD